VRRITDIGVSQMPLRQNEMSASKPIEFSGACPVPISQYPHVLLAHGGGGKLMHQLIGKMFLEAFRNPLLETQHDAAVM